jgi:hypothetical protein
MTNKHTVNITAESDKVPSATQGDMCDPIAVEGTPGRIAKFDTATTITDSIITESAGHIGVGTATSNAILTVTSAAAASPAIFARHTAPGGVGVNSDSPSGTGVLGISQSGKGMFGKSIDGNGVAGQSTSSDGVAGFSDSGNGVSGTTTTGVGVVGQSTTTTGVGVFGSSDGTGVIGSSTNFVGVAGFSTSNNGVAGSSDSGKGVVGFSDGGDGVTGFSARSRGMAGTGFNYGVVGQSTNSTNLSFGVMGFSPGESGCGVQGVCPRGHGVQGFTVNGSAVTGFVDSSGSGVAGYFDGNVLVTGSLSQGGGGFRIDHPLDPTTKTLAHSFVESPDMMNIYNGTVTTDANGEASVTLPDYFEALNQDFHYQLTVIGQFAQAVVAQEIRNNQFMIKTDQARVKVSWQVTGIRQDPWAVANRIAAEEEKAAEDKGRYLHPEPWGQPEEARVHPSPPQIDRTRLEEEQRQLEEWVQRMHERIPWKEGEGPTSPESP